jgi:hypothetical protein
MELSASKLSAKTALDWLVGIGTQHSDEILTKQFQPSKYLDLTPLICLALHQVDHIVV